jgi:Mg/Co/Ni transporter MgtE
VYDYVAGKADWLGMGMPSEGALANATIKSVARKVSECALQETLAAVKSRVSDDWNISVVIDKDRIVLGVLEFPITEGSDRTIIDLMKPAPLTFRPSVLIDEAIEYFDHSKRTFILVTKSTGELIGAIRKSDLI